MSAVPQFSDAHQSQAIVRELLRSKQVRKADNYFESRAAEITNEHIRICSIPAPPFGEHERAEFLREKFVTAGLTEAAIDEVGNCFALRKGRTQTPLLAVTAHLDTVFPAGTDFTIRRDGVKLLAPGVSDDGCGLAALMALVDALRVAEIETEGSLLFVGTVGEEGEGNLRGVRHLFSEGRFAKQINAFVSLDGAGIDRITNTALGSRRYRVCFSGRGGHSWGDFGTANPVHAAGRAIARLTSYPAPHDPRTTFNVGRIQGGAGVNVIPKVASMDVDLRSAAREELLRLDAFFRRTVREATDDENRLSRKGEPSLTVDLQLIGDRPGGETPANSELVEAAIEATRSIGSTPILDQSSTDSNIPISIGIPAITLGAGGTSGNSHTLEEWYDPRGRDLGLKRALLVMLAMVGAK
ncbi:MAG TPA: M20/M25/M40 family metallo-hydrolase [Pyrinomonadaceae bacterium]|nr:M20/M25/M40 family metallo-hydrolase [Pyrinomonadaceae bacterium]